MPDYPIPTQSLSLLSTRVASARRLLTVAQRQLAYAANRVTELRAAGIDPPTEVSEINSILEAVRISAEETISLLLTCWWRHTPNITVGIPYEYAHADIVALTDTITASGGKPYEVVATDDLIRVSGSADNDTPPVDNDGDYVVLSATEDDINVDASLTDSTDGVDNMVIEILQRMIESDSTTFAVDAQACVADADTKTFFTSAINGVLVGFVYVPDAVTPFAGTYDLSVFTTDRAIRLIAQDDIGTDAVTWLFHPGLAMTEETITIACTNTGGTASTRYGTFLAIYKAR